MEDENPVRETKKKVKKTSDSHVSDAANELLNEGKKKANELYEEGRNRVHEAQENIKEYSGELVNKIHEKPLKSLLIAGGIGFLLAAILRR